jgi:dTDP-4-dehydrorhamnose reductase
LGQKIVDLLVGNDRYEVTAISKGSNRNPNQAGYVFEQIDLLDHTKTDGFFYPVIPLMRLYILQR